MIRAAARAFHCARNTVRKWPRRSTCNSGVEAVHGIMEPEFYDLERFSGSLAAFLRQAYSYQLYFNLVRENSAKGYRTPEQLRAQLAPHIDPRIFIVATSGAVIPDGPGSADPPADPGGSRSTWISQKHKKVARVHKGFFI
jgi:hypothetical protein